MDTTKIKSQMYVATNSHNKDEQDFSLLSAIIYYPLVPFIYLFSLLPFRLLYVFSDFLYVILYYFIGYRKEVVLKNLQNSFPEKTDKEIDIIRRNFYHHFCDFFVETIKALTISKEEIIKRCKFAQDTFAIYSKFADEQKSVILAMGHIGNWEWASNTFNMQVEQQLFVIYHPITNKYFDALMSRIRSRNGTRLIPMKNTYREMAVNKKGLNVTAFVADQTPQPDHAYWTTFLNQDTPVFKGVEVIAKKMDMPIVYTSVKKIKRGYYEIFSEILIEDPKNTAEGELSEMYIRKLEQEIMGHPETWLWSHKRWKHKRTNA
jgi:KDO2-lipid IV(A) lauroyltransferase